MINIAPFVQVRNYATIMNVRVALKNHVRHMKWIKHGLLKIKYNPDMYFFNPIKNFNLIVLTVYIHMKIHQIIIIIEMVHVHIVQINIYARMKNVNHVFKNHLLLIHKYIVGAKKIQFLQELYLRVQTYQGYLIAIYVILNLNQNYTMY